MCRKAGISQATYFNWKKRYDAKFPGQFQIYSPYAYDATMVLVDAMKRANSWDPKVYIPELQKSNYKGVTAQIAVKLYGDDLGVLRTKANEIKAAIDALRGRLDEHADLAEDERRELARQLTDLARQQADNTRQQDRIERQLERICDRLDDDGRIGRALARLGRQPE